MLSSVEFRQIVTDRPQSTDRVLELFMRAVAEVPCVRAALLFRTSPSGDLDLTRTWGFPFEDEDLTPGERAGLDPVETAVRLTRYPRSSFRAFPLIGDTSLFGALVVALADEFRESELNFLKELADLAAIGLGKLHRSAQLERVQHDLEQSQEIMLRGEKLRLIGEMAASVSHDLKNILAPLMMQMEMIRLVIDNKEKVIALTKRFEATLMRGMETVERLREFSRQSPEALPAEEVDINKLVNEVLEICHPRLHQGTKTEISLGTPPAVRLKAAEFIAALSNVVVNAIDATQNRGSIVFSTGEDAGGAWVRVQDNGPGIPLEIQTRIFEPFFTTKGKQGTGLGLSMAYAFAQRHLGRLDLESSPGKGTAFTFWFPASNYKY